MALKKIFNISDDVFILFKGISSNLYPLDKVIANSFLIYQIEIGPKDEVEVATDTDCGIRKPEEEANIVD